MKGIRLFTSGFLLSIFLFVSPAGISAATPFPIMWGVGIGTNVSDQKFLDDAVSANPMYIFSDPYYEVSKLTKTRIQDIHSRLPQTKVILHIFCCNLFDQNKLQTSGSPIAKVSFSTQNTQLEFEDMWSNHAEAFMKNVNGEYVYNIIPHTNKMWLDAGQSYLMDMENPHFQNLLYKKFTYHVTDGGFDGIYLDLMMPGFPITHYSSRPAINGALMTYEQGKNKLVSLSRALQEKRKNDPDPIVRNAFIFTNSVGGNEGQFHTNTDLTNYNVYLQTQGVQIENPFQDYTNLTVDKWRETVNLIRDITSLRNNQMKGWLNYHISQGMNSRQQCDQQSLFTYASYLLGNQSPNFAFSFLCKIQDSTLPASERRVVPSLTLARIWLGEASGQYQALSSGVYKRSYEHGLVLVNPTTERKIYHPSQQLTNPYTGTVYPANTPIPLPTHSGLVLLREAPPPLSNPADLTDEGDTPGDQVNEADYNVLVAGFGTSYDIFDYNTLVENFGK